MQRVKRLGSFAELLSFSKLTIKKFYILTIKFVFIKIFCLMTSHECC